MRTMLVKDAGNQSMFWSGLTAIYGVYTVQEWIAIFGLIIGVISGLVNLYDKCKQGRIREAQEKRDQELHELRVKRLKKGLSDEQIENSG